MDVNEMEVSSRQSYECFTELRSVINVLDLAVDRRIMAPFGLPLPYGLGELFQSSPEMDMDSPVYCNMAVSMITASTAEPKSRVEMQEAFTPDSLRPPSHVRCTINALDLAVRSWRISAAVGLPPLRRERFRSSPEMKVDSPVDQAAIAESTEVPHVRVEVQDAFTPDSLRPPCHVRCTIDALQPPCHVRSTIDGLRHPCHVHRTINELAVDGRRMSVAAVGEPFRSSADPSLLQLPPYGESKTVSPAPVPRSDRRKSLWKRSRHFVWKRLVNAARRICFCQSFVDVE